MRVVVKDIPSHPVEMTGSLNEKDFNIDRLDVKCVVPVEVKATVERITNVLSVKAEAKTRFSFVCARCAELFEKDIKESIALTYELEPDTKYIDLGEDIRQEILIEFPVRNLCREDCKGICLLCGKNKNEKDCQCNLDSSH